jgi:hypothetical protein
MKEEREKVARVTKKENVEISDRKQSMTQTSKNRSKQNGSSPGTWVNLFHGGFKRLA